MGWTREGRKGAFRYYDSRGRRIADAAKLDRIERLAIPPAWKDVSISPRSTAKVQATGIDRAGRKQYLYNPEYRAAQEEAKYDKLIRFGEKLPGLRVVMAEHVDEELAAALRELLAVKGPRVFEYEWEGALYNLTSKRLNDYVKIYLGSEFTAKDFRTWGGTLAAAVVFAERARRDGFPETPTDEKRSVTAVMRRVAEQLGNTPAVCRASYVSPAVVEQYLEGRTLEDFRPSHLRVVGARSIGLEPEEQALLGLLRSWRIRQARAAA